jgi:hypothetical protein
LNCQSASTSLIELRQKMARYIARVRGDMLFDTVSLHILPILINVHQHARSCIEYANRVMDLKHNQIL